MRAWFSLATLTMLASDWLCSWHQELCPQTVWRQCYYTTDRIQLIILKSLSLNNQLIILKIRSDLFIHFLMPLVNGNHPIRGLAIISCPIRDEDGKESQYLIKVLKFFASSLFQYLTMPDNNNLHITSFNLLLNVKVNVSPANQIALFELQSNER